MANIDNVQLPDGSSYNIVDNTSGFATQNYVDSAVSSVTKTTIGLGNVDNTSDLNKPISTATQAALNTLDEDKADKTDIATVESGTTASRAYSVGELVYVSGTLYRVKTAIASGATFTAGTNIEVTNVSSAIAKFDRGSVSVTANGTKTRRQLLNDLYALLDTAKLNGSSYIQFSSRIYRYVQEYNGYWFTCPTTGSSGLTVSNLYLNSTASKSDEAQAPVGGANTYSDASSSIPTSGTLITLYY